jgi:hypothetical protein
LSACASMSGPTIPRGETELRWCQDPQKAGGFRVSSKIRLAPDQITADLMTKLGQVNYLLNLDCPFGLRARYANCGERDDLTNYLLMLGYCDVDITEHSYEDLVTVDPSNQDEILVTAPWSATYESRVESVAASRIGTLTDLGDQPINDIEYCDEVNCGTDCGTRTDGCSVWYAVTDVDASPYAAPNIIKGVKNVITGTITWTNAPVLGLNSNIENVECAGSRIVVSSNGDSVIAYNDSDTDQDTWNVVTIANAPTANPNALVARTSRELWLGANSGFVYKSTDGGGTWASVGTDSLTSQNINAIHPVNREVIYAVGDAGVILKTTDGGTVWTDLTETSTTGANLLVVKVPPSRTQEVYVGANNGNIYKSTDAGATFSQLVFSGDGVGTIDDLAFCGPCGDNILWILHNDAGPRARILRDLSGGAGGLDVEVVMDYTQVFTAGIDINALACCSENEVLAGGENNSGFPVILRTG